jgi:hypothetical protein
MTAKDVFIVAVAKAVGWSRFRRPQKIDILFLLLFHSKYYPPDTHVLFPIASRDSVPLRGRNCVNISTRDSARKFLLWRETCC